MQRPLITAVALLTLCCASCQQAEFANSTAPTTSPLSTSSQPAKSRSGPYGLPYGSIDDLGRYRVSPDSPDIEEFVGSFNAHAISTHPEMTVFDDNMEQNYFFYHNAEYECIALVPKEITNQIIPGKPVRIRAVRGLIDLGGPKGTRKEYKNDLLLVAEIVPLQADSHEPATGPLAANPNTTDLEEFIGCVSPYGRMQHPGLEFPGDQSRQLYFIDPATSDECIAFVPINLVGQFDPDEIVRVRGRSSHYSMGGPEGTKTSYRTRIIDVVEILPF